MIPPPYRRSAGLSTALSSVSFGVFLVPVRTNYHNITPHGALGLWNIERAGTIL